MARVSINVNEETSINRAVESDLTVGIVLESPRGVVDTPTLISSETELILMYGESTVQYPVLSFVRLYLRRYSGVYISRIKYKDAVPSSAKILNTEGTEVLKLVGNSYSDFENDYKVKITKDEITNNLSIEVLDTEGVVRSVVRDLPPTLVDLVIEYNSKSQYFTIELLADADGEVDITQQYVFSGGVKGSEFTESDIIAAIDKFNTININRLDLICAPGLNYNAKIVNSGVNVATKRAESLYLLDFPEGSTYDDVIDLAKQLPRTSFGAAYYPSHLQSVPTGSSNASKLNVPASALALFAYAIAADTSRWSAPAGFSSDFKLTNVIKASVELSSEQADSLYEATNDRPAINPIIYDNTIGYLVDGQRTLADKTSIQYPINVAKLVRHVYHIAREVSKGFRYKPNTQFTWDDWTLRMTTQLSNIRGGGGIDQFEVAMGTNTMTDDEIISGLMRGIIRIKPVFVADYITINIGITTEDIIVDRTNTTGLFGM